MKYFAVVDTNVIVSAMLKSNSTPAAVLREVLTGNISLLANEEIFDEYTEVLSRKKFGFDADTVILLMNELKNFVNASSYDMVESIIINECTKQKKKILI